MSLVVDDDLHILNNGLPESGVLNVSHGASTPFNLRLRPRVIGQLGPQIVSTIASATPVFSIC